MPETMPAVVCHGPEDYRLEEVAVPTPGPGEALVKVEAVGICASDLKCYHGAAKFWGDDSRPAWAETEVIPGHEFVGTVVELDDEVVNRIQHLQIGCARVDGRREVEDVDHHVVRHGTDDGEVTGLAGEDIDVVDVVDT